MAGSYENFRNALNGYNKNDVVSFIQRMTVEHDKSVKKSKEQILNLQNEMNEVKAERETLSAQLQASSDEKNAMQEELQKLKDELAAAKADAQKREDSYNELELAAYRRAESVERQAKERAAVITQKLEIICSDSKNDLSDISAQIDALSGELAAKYQELDVLLNHAKSSLDTSCDKIKSTIIPQE